MCKKVGLKMAGNVGYLPYLPEVNYLFVNRLRFDRLTDFQ